MTISSSEAPLHDRWAEWILHRRQGGDPERYRSILDELAIVRNRVIEHASPRSGDVLLDVGAGMVSSHSRRWTPSDRVDR